MFDSFWNPDHKNRSLPAILPSSEALPLGTLVKFVPPTVAAGKVYVPNYDNAVNVYGLITAGRR